MILDGFAAHLTLRIAQLAVENQIEIICLPPHLTSRLQPLDVCVFRGVKAAWRSILQEYFRDTEQQNMLRDEIPGLPKKLFLAPNVFDRKNAVSGKLYFKIIFDFFYSKIL